MSQHFAQSSHHLAFSLFSKCIRCRSIISQRLARGSSYLPSKRIRYPTIFAKPIMEDGSSAPTTLKPVRQEEAGTATEVVDQDAPVALSKKAQKRALKAAQMEEKRKDRKARDKEIKKEKQRIKAEKRAAGEDLEDERLKKRQRTAIKPFDARIVIDLGFDDKMLDKEVKSLCSQLNFTYASNRKGPARFSTLLFTSLNGRTKETLDNIQNKSYLRWKGVQWWEEGYDKLWKEIPVPNSETPEVPAVVDTEGDPAVSMETPQASEKSTIVYLTADSEDEINELTEGETYIIGGLCDHNRYKALCLNKAKEQGIRHARLPIGSYLGQLSTRKVLTVNQVYEILLKWVETRDWEAALLSVIPKRKFKEKYHGTKKSAEDEGKEVDESEDGIDEAEVNELCEAVTQKDESQ